MRAALAILIVAALAPSAHADDTFEAKADGALHIKHVDDIVWALTATCDSGDDTQNRQCRMLRDKRAAELANATLLVDAEPSAFKVGAWDSAKKSVPLVLTGCILCSGAQIDGKTWFVVGATDGASPHWAGKALEASSLYNNARPIADAAAAKTWVASVSAPAVQLIAKLGPKTKRTVEAKNVLVLDVIGYRVYSRCDGSVVVANPKSGAAESDKKACAAAPATK